MKNYRIRYYKCKNPMYHKNIINNEVYTKYNINISTYIPPIIKKIINSIPHIFDHEYIICPFYKNLYNYQIGITETGKIGETTYDTIIRGINEECGLDKISWNINDNYIHNQKNKNWYGICINNNQITYNPQLIQNSNHDNKSEKIAAIIHNKIQILLEIYKTINGEIHSDNISGLGFISVSDCKQIINFI